jgi:hypothetical protein
MKKSVETAGEEAQDCQDEQLSRLLSAVESPVQVMVQKGIKSYWEGVLKTISVTGSIKFSRIH